MLKEFANLTPAEQQQMFDAIPLVTILVAGADDNIDEVELAEAKRMVDIRSFNNRGQLIAFYEKLEDNFLGRVQELLKELPDGRVPRQNAIFARLSVLNGVLAKLDVPFGYLYYRSLRTFAKHVAESHGGFLRFMTVGPMEAEVLELPMLAPVAKPPKSDYPELY